MAIITKMKSTLTYTNHRLIGLFYTQHTNYIYGEFEILQNLKVIW